MYENNLSYLKQTYKVIKGDDINFPELLRFSVNPLPYSLRPYSANPVIAYCVNIL